MALSNHPEAVALFFALSLFRCRSSSIRQIPGLKLPAGSGGTPLFLPPSLAELASEAEGVGLRAHVLPTPRSASAAATSRHFWPARDS
jgi:hypothetical protein